MDTENIRSKIIEAYRQGPEALVELIRELVAQLESLSVRVAALEAENAALRARLGTNSRFSGKPPSSDGPGDKPHPKSQRVVPCPPTPPGKPSGRKPGGPAGTSWHYLAAGR